MSATDILGKIGEKVGGEFSSLRVSLGNLYATKVSLGNVVNTIDFSPYSTKVSLGLTQTSIANLVDGTNAFTDLKATRAEIGDLVVNGTTTTINTQTLSVEDNIIEVNLKSDGSETAQTGGLEINRGVGLTEIVVNGHGKFVEDIGSNHDMNNTINGTNLDGRETYTLEGANPLGLKIVYYSNPNASDANGTLDTTSAGWVIEQNNNNAIGLYQDFSGGSENLGNGSIANPANGISITQSVDEKAKLIWDDQAGEFKALLGSSATKLAVSEIKVPNSSGVKINNVALGDYSTFESAFNTANS